MRMIVQALHQRPRLAGICRFKKRRRFDAAIKRIRLIGMAQRNLPDLFHRIVSALGKFYAVGFRLSPGLPEVIRGAEIGTPIRAVHCCP
jgi:hypothetical protein